RRARRIPSACRKIQGAARGRRRCRASPEGRAVQALGRTVKQTESRNIPLTKRNLRMAPSTIAALTSGLLLALSFPRYGHGTVGFVALVPLFVALCGWSGRAGQYPGVTGRRGFFLGLMTGFVHFGGTVYWTGATVQTFGGL